MTCDITCCFPLHTHTYLMRDHPRLRIRPSRSFFITIPLPFILNNQALTFVDNCDLFEMASKAFVQQFINNLKNVKIYDKLCQHVTVVSAGNGSIKATMPVMEEHLNGRGTLHGGCTASLIDSVSSYGFATADDGKPGVSVDMSIQYIGAAKLGDIITIESTALKQKGLVRFADVLVTDQDGKIIAKASHTKAMK